MPYVYILQCGDGTLYTGYTTDLKRRLQERNEGAASRYTRSRQPAVYVYTEYVENKSLALKRELAIKQMTRREKMRLIQQTEPCTREECT